MLDRYFDHAATTPVDPHVRRAMLPFLEEACGNANSLHGFGRRAADAVEAARESIALLVGAEDPSEIIFTSGATESNNWVVQRLGAVACSPFEHSSIIEPVLALGGQPLESSGYLLYPLANTKLWSIMHVNNETGAMIEPPPGAPLLHRDLTQSVGKVLLPAASFDLASFSAHKLYGPKGIGALWLRSPVLDEPLLYGGEHELGLRAGTLNVPAIAGFGEAARIALDRQAADFEHASNLRATLLEGLRGAPGWVENVHSSQSPFILSLSFVDLEGQGLVEALDVRGFAISSGAACSSGSTDPSHVLAALGVDAALIRGTIRISFGRTNSVEAADNLAKSLVEAADSVRKLRK